MRAPKDCAGAHGEIKLASVAAVEAVLAGRDALATLALRALHAIRPQTALKIDAGGLLIRECLKQLKRADR